MKPKTRIHFAGIGETLSKYFLAVMMVGLLACSAQEEWGPSSAGTVVRSERIEQLIRRMTIDEKIGQMTLIDAYRLMGTGEWDRGPLNPEWLDIVFSQMQTGSLLSGGGAAPLPNTPVRWAKFVNELQKYAMDHSRLRIPILYGVDAVHGFNGVVGATIFPHNLGMASSRDPELQRQIAARTAEAARAVGVNWTFSPVADLGRDPRWGRFYETFGEDHFLVAEMVEGAVLGYQGHSLRSPMAIAATAKHFIGYGAPETGQDRTNAEISLRALRDEHLEPFRRAVDSGVATVMVSGGLVNGIPGHASKYLLTDILRGELGFDGLVVSDWNELQALVDSYHIAADLDEAVAIGINAGVDLYMVPHNGLDFFNTLRELVADGRVPMARIDQAVARVLALKYDLGLFKAPLAHPENANHTVIGHDRGLALKAAQESLVLLRNESNTLPLRRDQRVLVTGASAENGVNLLGGWSIGWQGAHDPTEQPPYVTVMDGIRTLIGPAHVIRPEISPELTPERARAVAVRALRGADAAVVVVGEPPYAESLGDSTTLQFPIDDRALIAALAATGKPVIVVIIAGRPLILDAVAERAQAILMAHLPGTEGGHAIANALFGVYNPSGKLAYSWPKRVGQLPLRYNAPLGGREGPNAEEDMRIYDPLFPFGHGLSYTTFRHSGLSLARHRVRTGERVEAWVEVTNTGARAGEHIVELYVRPDIAAVSPNRRQLVAFTRVLLEPGQSQSAALQFPVDRLATTSGDVPGLGPRLVRPGVYELLGEDDLKVELTVSD